jgi:hypothetical protein
VEAYDRNADNSSVLLLRYEDFCQHPADELHRILDGIGLEIESHQLDPTAYGERHGEKHEAHARLEEPITQKSVGMWREKLSEAEVRRVERTLAEEMQAFGYSLEYEAVA